MRLSTAYVDHFSHDKIAHCSLMPSRPAGCIDAEFALVPATISNQGCALRAHSLAAICLNRQIVSFTDLSKPVGARWLWVVFVFILLKEVTLAVFFWS